MVTIEYTMICVDNSEYMRNGDVRPSRLDSELDAVNIIAHSIMTSRVENRVGLVSLSDSPQVIQPLTSNEINLLRKLYAIKPETLRGEINLINGLKTALLTITFMKKIRGGMGSTKMRIVVFLGSPFTGDEKELNSLVKDFNKSKVSLDIVSFGQENSSKLKMFETFVGQLKNSNFIDIPNDGRMLANAMADSPILSSSSNVRLINENIDPELAMAMKMSTEDNNSQFDADMQRALEESASQSGKNQSPMSEEEENLQRAIDMSMDFMKQNEIPIAKQSPSKTQNQSQSQSKYMSEEELLARTLQMSLMQQEQSIKKEQDNNGKSAKKSNQSQKTNEQSKNGKSNGRKKTKRAKKSKK